MAEIMDVEDGKNKIYLSEKAVPENVVPWARETVDKDGVVRLQIRTWSGEQQWMLLTALRAEELAEQLIQAAKRVREYSKDVNTRLGGTK